MDAFSFVDQKKKKRKIGKQSSIDARENFCTGVCVCEREMRKTNVFETNYVSKGTENALLTITLDKIHETMCRCGRPIENVPRFTLYSKKRRTNRWNIAKVQSERGWRTETHAMVMSLVSPHAHRTLCTDVCRSCGNKRMRN